MFGYIVVNKDELKFKEFNMYHSYYCGLCRSLKERYGMIGQISLSYDMTFVLMLLSALYEPETEERECRCMLHPLEKHTERRNFLTDYVADMNVLLTYYKCRDDWEDEKKLVRMVYGRMLEGKAGKKKDLYAGKLSKLALLMQDYSEAECDGKADIDTMAGLFGKVMAEITVCREDEWSDNLRRFGFYLGKFIYLVDAYEDIEEDIKKGNYNPFRKKYEQPDFEEECHIILTMMMSECCREFEKLPILDNVEILRNILYSGVWCRYEAVREKRKKKKNGKNSDAGWCDKRGAQGFAQSRKQ